MNAPNAPVPTTILVKREDDDVVATNGSGPGRAVARRGAAKTKVPIPPRQPRVQTRPVPHQGMPGIVYKLQQLLRKLFQGYDPSYPKMNAKEQAEYDFERQLERIEGLENLLKRQTTKVQRVVAVFNNKGGASKTPLVANLVCVAQQVTRDPYLYIDANENVGTGHVLMGVERGATILLRKAVASRSMLNTFTRLSERTAKHLETGVRFIGSDFRTSGKAGEFTQEDFVDMLRITDSTVHSTYVDTGNGFINVSNIGSIMVANALIFPAHAGKNNTFDGLVLTMQRYMELGHDVKVTKGFVVINATPPGATKAQYLEKIEAELAKNPYQKLNEATNSTEQAVLSLEDLGITEERLFLIPFSQHIAEDGIVNTDPSVMGYDTYEAYLTLLTAIYGQNAQYGVTTTPQHSSRFAPNTSALPTQPKELSVGTTQ